jgi:pentose-5-phosphate-3-epimerase
MASLSSPKIEITPAILTSDFELMCERFDTYLAAGFSSIDIDIADDKFLSYNTVDYIKVVTLLVENQGAIVGNGMSIGIDLAVSNLPECLAEIIKLQTQTIIGDNLRIYVDSKIDKREINNFENSEFKYKALVLQAKENPTAKINFAAYQEIQCMGVKERKQGSDFYTGVIDKIVKLRDLGFEGVISIDGGVNLRTAPMLLELIAAGYLNRVSVGSYFQTAKDVKLSKQKLELALNMLPSLDSEEDSDYA